MGMSEVHAWVLIRRYDKLDSHSSKSQTSLQRLILSPGLLGDELKSTILRLIDVEDDDTKVLKVRRQDNNLIPLSTLLHGSTAEKPFIIDVVRVHQFCPAEKRSIPSSHIHALESNFLNLKKRVEFFESIVPDVTNIQIQTVEDAASKLANCVNFLDRRLDELLSERRSQVQSSV